MSVIAHFTLWSFSLDLIPCFWPIFGDFQNEAASLCVTSSTDKDMKITLMVSRFNLKSYLSNPSPIFKIEAMKVVLCLVKCVYVFLTYPVLHGKKVTI